MFAINFETLLEFFFLPLGSQTCDHRALIKIEEGVYIFFFCSVKVMVSIFLSCEKSSWENSTAGFSLEDQPHLLDQEAQEGLQSHLDLPFLL